MTNSRFTFKDFGTFAGPQDTTGNYNYDLASQEGSWWKDLPTDSSFKSSDLGAYLFHLEQDYVGFHCDGTSTSMMTLEASYGNIPVLNIFADEMNVNGDITSVGDIVATGEIETIGTLDVTGTLNLNGQNVQTEIELAKTLPAKGFDIPHPNKPGHRLRHICVEGPENGPIYVRGKLDGPSFNLPDYWAGLIDDETITVHLTPIGCHQELFVESINWSKVVNVRNSNGGPINCYYQVWADRKFDDQIHVEYEGESPADYPGDPSRFSIAGYDYDKRKKK